MRPRKSGESAYAPIPPIADRIPYFIAPETAPETAARAAGSACDICRSFLIGEGITVVVMIANGDDVEVLSGEPRIRKFEGF